VTATNKLSAADLTKNARIINEVHKAVIEAQQTSLQHAITAGTTLRACKDVIPHGEWTEWLERNCPDISEETARLYIRLADPKNADRLEEAAEQNGNAVAHLSVRGAARLLAKPQTEEQKAKRKRSADNKAANKANHEAHAAARAAIEEQVKALAPDEVFKALKDAHWEIDKLRELANLLNAHLRTLGDPLAIPPSLQRPASGLTSGAAAERRV